MRFFLFTLTAFYFLLNACSEPNDGNSTSENQQPVEDTVKAALIDTLAFKIDRQWTQEGPNFHIVPIGQRDTVKYIELDGKLQRISSIFITDSVLTWLVFHIVDDELKLVRFREGREMPERTVKEAFSYLENGKIFFAKERSKPLEPGEPLAAFRFLPFVNNVRTPAEMQAEYAPYWEITKKAVEQDRASRK